LRPLPSVHEVVFMYWTKLSSPSQETDVCGREMVDGRVSLCGDTCCALAVMDRILLPRANHCLVDSNHVCTPSMHVLCLFSGLAATAKRVTSAHTWPSCIDNKSGEISSLDYSATRITRKCPPPATVVRRSRCSVKASLDTGIIQSIGRAAQVHYSH